MAYVSISTETVRKGDWETYKFQTSISLFKHSLSVRSGFLNDIVLQTVFYTRKCLTHFI